MTVDARMHQSEYVNDTFDEFLDDISGGASKRAIADRAGIESSTLTRQLKGELKVQTVVAICRAYDANLLRGFVAAGFITQAEAESMASLAGISKATDSQLAEEILRRVRSAEKEHPVLTNPISDVESVGGDPEDLSEMDEDALKRRDYDLAANTDQSAERLDPEDS